jgi:hypothetical protein
MRTPPFGRKRSSATLTIELGRAFGTSPTRVGRRAGLLAWARSGPAGTGLAIAWPWPPDRFVVVARTEGSCHDGIPMDDWLLPRWAIGSVRLHLNIDDLILAVLLFDGIVMPTPENESEFDRWKKLGWEPEEAEFRRINLGDLVYEVPWDETLRSDFGDRWKLLLTLGAESEALAYGLTPQVIALKAWDDVYGQAQAEGRVVQRPVPVAWYPQGTLGLREVGVMAEGEPHNDSTPVQREVALLFRREVEVPSANDPDEALAAAVKLAENEDFIEARRALFDWELKIAGQDIPLADAISGLHEAAERYDQHVRDSAKPMTTVRRGVRVLVPAGASHAAHLSGIPGAGAVAGWAMRSVMAHLAPLPPAPAPAVDPGAALSMTRRKMSAVLASS